MTDFLIHMTPWITLLITLVATVSIFSGIDDLLMDALYLAWRVYKRLFFSRKHKVLTREDLVEIP